METHPGIRDLTIACVTSVKNATGLELDLSQETLPVLDHYAELVDSPQEEIVSLLAPMCGAYFGELLRRTFDDGDWQWEPEEHRHWRLDFKRSPLSLNPVGVALEVLTRTDAGGWGAHLQAPSHLVPRLERALAVLGEVSEEDYFRFAVRFEGIEQAYRALLNNPADMDSQG